MSGEIAQAFVRVRPNLTGFQAETEGGIKSALTSIGKITAGFFAVAGITHEFKQIADAAAQHEASFAVLDQSIKNAGASAKVFGKDIEALIERESKLKGFSEADLAASFTKLVGVTKDSGKAFKDLSLVEDISRARHIDVSTAALSLSRALQGSTTSLSRLGIVVPKVTTEQAKLRAEHDRLAASGVKFTGSVKEAYSAQLAAAKVADAQGSKLKALQVIQDRFGGSAKAFANSAAGQFERFGVSVHLLEISLGKLLLPTLSTTIASLTRWVDELTSSETVHRDVAAGVSLVKTAFADLRATVQFLEPVLRPVIGLLQDIVGFSGAGGILVAVGAFKAVGAATEVAAAAQRKYLELVELGRGNVEQDAAAREGSVSATGQASAALERHAALLGEDAAASTRAAAGTAEFTGSLRANEAALSANAVTNAARGSEIATTSAVGQAAAVGPDLTAGAETAAAAAQGTEALKELSQAASDAGSSIADTTDTVGTLAGDIDHSGNVISKASLQARKASDAHKGLARETREAAAAQKSLDASQAGSVAATGRRTASLTTEVAALQATGAAQQGLAATTVKTSLQESEALLATARAAEIGSREQVVAYEAAAAAALKAEAVTVGAAERSAGAIGIGGANEERIARNRITGQLAVARANPAGSAQQTQAYETAIRRAQQLAGAEAAVGDAAVVSGAKVAGAAGTVEGALAGESAALNGAATAAGRSVAANEALAAARAAVAAGALDEAGQERIAAAAKLEGAAAARAEATALAELAAANAALSSEQFLTGGVGVPGGLGAGASAQAARAAEAEAVLAALGRENAAAKLAETGATNDLAAASAKTVPALAEETAAISASAAASERAAVANAELAESLLAVSAASTKASAAQLPVGLAAGGPIKEAGREIEKTAASTGRLARATSSAGAALTGLGRGALAFVGGTPTLVAAALAATAFGVYKLATAESAADRANDKFRDGLLALGGALRGISEATRAANEALSSLKTDRISVAEAQISVERAKSALATTTAGQATLEYKQLTQDLAAAEDQLRLAVKRVGETEDALADARAKHARSAHAAEVERRRDVERTLKLERDIADPPKPKGRGGQGGRVLVGLEAGTSFIRGLLDTRSKVSQFADKIEKDQEEAAKKGFPRLARQLGDLAALTRAIDRVPNKKEIQIFFKNPQIGGAALFEKLALEQLRATKSASGFVASLETERRAIEKNDPGLAKRAGLIENLARATGRKVPPQVVQFIFRSNVEAGVRRMISELDRAGVSVRAFGRAAEHEVDAFRSSNPDLARRIEILRQFGALIGRLPNRHETNVVLKAPTTLGAVIALQKELATMDGAAKAHGKKSGEDWAQQFFAGLTKIPFLNNAFKGLAENAGKAARASIDDGLGRAAAAQLKEHLATAKQVVDTAREGVLSARQSLADARQTVHDAQRSLADAITSGQQEINDSLKSAGSNLISIGQSLSDDISKFFDAQSAKKTGAKAVSGPLADRLKELTALINAGKGTPAIIQKAKEVEAELNAQQDKESAKTPTNDKRKERVQRRLADLTDEFNTGKISLARFNREVTALLKREHINYRNAGRVLGVAFADGFRAELIGLRQQAAAIAKFGRRPGLGAFGVNVEKPAEVRSKVQENIARDQEAVAKAQNVVLKDIKAVAAKERTLAAANLKADHIRTALGSANRHQTVIAQNTSTLVRQNAQLLKEAKERASNSASLPQRAGPVAAPTAALVLPILDRGEKAKSGSAQAKRLGREAIRDFEALGGELGAGLRHGLARGEHRFFQQLEDLIRRGHRHARRTARSGSPSLLFAEFGDELAQGVALGVSRSAPLLERASARLVGRASASASARQRIRIERFFEVKGDLAAFLRRFAPKSTVKDEIVRQRISLFRSITAHQRPFPAVPARLDDASVRQAVRLTRTVSASQPSFPAVPRQLTPSLVRQAIHLARSLAVNQPRFPLVPGRLPAAFVRQSISLLRELALHGNLAAFLAKAEKDVPRSLSPKAVRQQIRVERTLHERESVKQILSRAERLGSLATGRASVTVLVGANIRPASRVIDELRRTAERRSVSLGVRPAAATGLLRAATPHLAPADHPAAAEILRGVARPKSASGPTLPIPAAIPALEKGIEPLRESVANRQRGTLIGEERRQARLLEQILVEERKQTFLLREEVHPRPRGRNPKKNPREATREATATAINNLVGS